MSSKQTIRRQMLRRVRALAPEAKARRSAKIFEKLKRLKAFRQAGCVMAYWATEDEVDTRPMVQQALETGKRVALPLTRPRTRRLIPCAVTNPHDDLAPGPYGILQPVSDRMRPIPLEAIDLVLVPGVAFDRRGSRLGRGGGYFDRFLARLPDRVPKIGLAFRFQVVDRLPHAAHDIRVTRLVTD